MRWSARIAVALTLSALAVAALTWAGWPRPRSVLTTDAPAFSPVVFDNDIDEPNPPYRLIRQDSHADGNLWHPASDDFWFLAPDGRLLGPWRPGAYKSSLGFDRAGRLLAQTRPGGRGYELARYDPETGREETLVSFGGPGPAGSLITDDRSTLALAWVEPLAFDVYDVADGRKRTRLTFPGRAGGLDDSQARVAALAWALSPDGRELLLAEAWDGAKRLGPPGVEVYDVATGRLARRLDHLRDAADPPGPPDAGVHWMMFTGTHAEIVSYNMVSRRPSGSTDGWSNEYQAPRMSYSWDFASGRPLPPATPVDPSVRDRREREVGDHGGRTLRLMSDPMEYRVLGPDGVPLAGWRPVPGEFGDEHWLITRPQPGRPAVVYEFGDQARNAWARWIGWLSGRLRPADVPTSHYLYHDWSAGEFRRVYGVPTGPQTSAVGPHDLAILTQTPTGGTLSLWDLPPPRPPWRWSVPAGVGVGVLLTAAGVRGRRLLADRTRVARSAYQS